MWQEREGLYTDLKQVGEKESMIGKKTREKASHAQEQFCTVWKARRFTAVSPGSICNIIAVGDLGLIKSKSVLPVWQCMEIGDFSSLP